MGSNQLLTSGGQPTSTDVSDAQKVLARLGYKVIPPELAPALKAITVSTVAALRMITGDINSNAGPACCLLNATATPGDGGQGAFYWHNTTTALDDNGATTVQVMGPSGQFKTPGAWLRILQPSAGRLLRRSWLSAGSSLVAMAGCKSAIVYVQGVGGGSGGTGASSGASGGGGGGSYAEFATSTVPAAWAYTLGTVGAAGAVTPTAGGTGTATTFSDGATTVSVPGGLGSAVGGTFPVPPIGAAGGGNPTVTVGPGSIALALPGQPGLPPTGGPTSGTVGTSGTGGSSRYGSGGIAQNTSGAGTAGKGFGGGAGGSVSTGVAVAGAAGAPALIILEEYSG